MPAIESLRCHARGATLIEAMLAVVVVAIGLVGAAQLQRTIRQHADAAAERSVAVRLAQDAIERLRAAPDLLAATDDEAELVDGAAATHYTLRRSLEAPDFGSRGIALRVAWTDRRGAAQAVVLTTTAQVPAPHAVGALLLADPAATHLGAWDRSVHLPLDAQDLGDGRSRWQPRRGVPETWLLDNRSAGVLTVCADATLASCDDAEGRLVTGVLRASQADAPDPAAANDPPPDAVIVVAPMGTPFTRPPHCVIERFDGGAERALRYACVVHPEGTGGWSGRIGVQPLGWTIGTTAADRRVCRYSADSDGSGSVDSAFEHPADHVGVAGPLAHQNFLLVRGDQPCPVAAAAILAPTPNGVFADRSTAPHQP